MMRILKAILAQSSSILLLTLLVSCTTQKSVPEQPTVRVTEARVETSTPTESAAEPVAGNQTPQATEQTDQLTPTATSISTGRRIQFDDRLADVGFSLPITIQHISQSSAWLFFELEEAVEGEVFFWVEGEEEVGLRSVEFGSDTSRHIVQLSDLLPETRYMIRVGLPDQEGRFRSPGLAGEDWGVTRLKTYPEDPERLRVAVIGDSGFGEPITFALAAQISALEPDILIHTGDLVYNAFENGTPQQAYQAKYYWPFQKALLNAPIYAVPGNHEYYADASIGDLPYYFEVFPKLNSHVRDGSWIESDQDYRRWYALRVRDIQFIFLDSQQFYRSEGVAQQTQWLQQVLAEHEGPTVGVYHIATYTSGRHERDGLPIQQSWIPHFQSTETILILSGHDHNYERLLVNGLNYIVSGGGSRKLYGLDQALEGSQIFAAESHFVLLEFYNDRIEVETINQYGDIIDKAVLSTD